MTSSSLTKGRFKYRKNRKRLTENTSCNYPLRLEALLVLGLGAYLSSCTLSLS